MMAGNKPKHMKEPTGECGLARRVFTSRGQHREAHPVFSGAGGEFCLLSIDPRISRISFTVAYAAYIVAAGWDATTFLGVGAMTKNVVCGVFQVVAVLMFAFKLLTQRYTKKQLFILIVAGLLVVTSAYISHDFGAVWIFVLVASCQDIELQYVARVACYATITVIVLAALGFAVGICPAVFAQRGNTGPIRYSLGFAHTNLFANNVAVAGVAWFVSRVPKVRAGDLAVLVLSVVVIFAVTNSRTMTFAMLLVLLVAGIYVLCHKAPLPTPIAILFCLAMLASIGIMVCYPEIPENVRIELDALLTNRPYYLHAYFEQLGLTAFGGDIAGAHIRPIGVVRTGLMLDNAYIALLLGKGVLVFAGVFLGLLICVLRARSDTRYLPFLFAMLFFSVAGFAENISNSIAMNFSLACMAYLLYGPPSRVDRDGIVVRAGTSGAEVMECENEPRS